MTPSPEDDDGAREDGTVLPPGRRPRHIAIIMDGNNRWARQRHLPGVAGHTAGVESVRQVAEACGEQRIEYLTLFAFSSENWQRPREEVNALMDLFQTVLRKEVSRLHENGVRLRIVGDRSRFNEDTRERMRAAEELTRDNDRLNLVMAMNYGGRWDIVEAARRLAQDVQAGHCAPEDIDVARFHGYTSLAGIPDPDLCIRTGGDHRISNFLLWQFAYTELYFTDEYWPDFRGPSLCRALQEYGRRQRRFGLSAEQAEAMSQ